MRAVPYIVSHHFTISICQSDKIGRFLLYTTMDASLTRSLASFAVCPWTHQAQGRRPRVLKGCPLSTFTHIADLPSRRGLSVSTASSSLRFTVPQSVGNRAFSVAGPQVWTFLPPEVTSAPSLATFRTRLKTFLFTESYPDIRLILHFCVYALSVVDLAVF